MAKICVQCEKEIGAGQMLTEANDKSYHKECFKCAECTESIEGKFFPTLQQNKLVNVCQKCRYSKLSDSKNCCGCLQPADNPDNSIIHEDKLFHRSCFVCSGCGQEINSKISFRLVAHNEDKNKIAYRPQCKKCAEIHFSAKCHNCKKPIAVDSKYMKCDDKYWHNQCFCCQKCKKKIEDGKFCEVDDSIRCAKCSS